MSPKPRYLLMKPGPADRRRQGAKVQVEHDDPVQWTLFIALSSPSSKPRTAKMGPCGQAPTDHTAFAGFLVEAGIDSMSVGPETFLRVKRYVATAEAGHARVQVD